MLILLRTTAIVLPFFLLAGCATKPVDPEFGYQSDGSYKLNPQEAAKTCAVLTTDIRGEVPAIAAHQTRATQGRVLSGVLFIAGAAASHAPLTDYGRESSDNAKRLRARADAYNAHLVTKKCPPVDIDDLIARENEQKLKDAPVPETNSR